MPDNPTVTRQVGLLGKFAIDAVSEVVSSGKINASPEEATRRYQICLVCPFFGPIPGKDSIPRCSKCGCNMGRKVQWKAAKCADSENPKW